MSTLWTPDGERPVGRRSDTPPAASPPAGPAAGSTGFPDEPTEEELKAQMAALQEQMARTPVEVMVANHAYGLFELAALHLSLQPPQLPQARSAIDAYAALVEGMAGRLGEGEASLIDGLDQLRMAFVQINATAGGEPPAP